MYYSHFWAFRVVLFLSTKFAKYNWNYMLSSSQLADQNLCHLNLVPAQQMVSISHQGW
jgi:hypothetical protein